MLQMRFCYSNEFAFLLAIFLFGSLAGPFNNTILASPFQEQISQQGQTFVDELRALSEKIFAEDSSANGSLLKPSLEDHSLNEQTTRPETEQIEQVVDPAKDLVNSERGNSPFSLASESRLVNPYVIDPASAEPNPVAASQPVGKVASLDLLTPSIYQSIQQQQRLANHGLLPYELSWGQMSSGWNNGTAESAEDSSLESEADSPTDSVTPVLDPETYNRKKSLERCLAVYYTRQVDADVLRPWSIMHGLIGYGKETAIIYRGKRYNAVEYLCANGVGDDRRILFAMNGQLRTRVGAGVQGHEGQLLAMFAQSDIPVDQPMTVDGLQFTVHDLVDWEMKNCRSDSELTFKLLSLSHYLDSSTTWRNLQGEEWNLERLLMEELAQPIDDGACGGSHRLMAISYAVDQRRKEGKSLDGHWARADKFIREFHKYTWSLQLENGGFSTDWFRSKSYSGDIRKSLYTTGHILEWLTFSLPDEELDDPRLQKTVDYLIALMMSAPNYDLAVGPRGHAIRALRLYEQRVFEKTDYKQLMNDARLVNNNPQNGGGTSTTVNEIRTNQARPAGNRRGIFGRRR